MRRILAITIISAIYTALGGAPQASAAAKRNLELVDITQEPAQGDWRYFHQMPEGERQKWWDYHHAKGKTLGDWSWAWRIGWVRVCSFSQKLFCRKILADALFDQALVVRAEAASRLGSRFENTKNKQVLKLLARAYHDQRNSRGGKPLFIQYRILYSIKQIGGEEAIALGQRLASSTAKAADYWQNVSRF